MEEGRVTKLHERLKKLFDTLDGTDHITILPHNNPDPDAIASAVGLSYLLKESLGIDCKILYGGIIGRAENRALVRYLNCPLQRLTVSDLNSAEIVALVDTQPGTGNNPLISLPRVTIVIDHHPWRDATARANFADVRPKVGATASMMVEYLRLAKLKIHPSLATALFYGIKTDTMGLGRGTSRLDMEAICYLLPRIDLEALLKIERVQVPVEYFKSFATTLQSTRVYGNVVVAYIGAMNYPDLTAEMADFLLRMKGSRWVICMGTHSDRFIISVRTQNQRGAGQLVQSVVGSEGVAGGHGAMAGGQVYLSKDKDPEQLATTFTERILAELNIPVETAAASLI